MQRWLVGGWLTNEEADTPETDIYREKFERGDKAALLRAIYKCAWQRLPLPEWVCVAFVKALEETKTRPPLHGSWDDVFGRPHKKGKKLTALRQAIRLRNKVYAAVIDMRAKQPHTDHFLTVAKRFGIGRQVCRKYFSHVDRQIRSKNVWERLLAAAAVGIAVEEMKNEGLALETTAVQEMISPIITPPGFLDAMKKELAGHEEKK